MNERVAEIWRGMLKDVEHLITTKKQQAKYNRLWDGINNALEKGGEAQGKHINEICTFALEMKLSEL